MRGKPAEGGKRARGPVQGEGYLDGLKVARLPSR